MRILFTALFMGSLLLGSLQAAEDPNLPPNMGPSDNTEPPPVSGTRPSTGTQPRTALPVTSQPALTPPTTLAADEPKPKTIMVTPTPKPNPTPTAGSNAVAANPGTTGSGSKTGGTTGSPGTTPVLTTGNPVGTTVQPNFQVVDLALGASQEVEIANNSGTGSFQFPSGQGVVSIEIAKDGSVVMTGVKGQVDLQCQTQPLPIAGVMGENQQLKITGVTKFIAKKVDNRVFISLRLSPDTITIGYKDLTPDNQSRPKENYAFKFLMVGYPPILVVNGKTIQLVQGRDGLVKKSENNFANVLSVEIYRQNEDVVLITGGSLLGFPASP